MARFKPNKKRDKKRFNRTAKRTRDINVGFNIPRGGIRL